jgi:hypothetical protein
LGQKRQFFAEFLGENILKIADWPNFHHDGFTFSSVLKIAQVAQIFGILFSKKVSFLS